MPLREAMSLAIKNNADSLMRSGGGSWPGNEDLANNWHGVRYGAAALGYLVSNHDDGGKLSGNPAHYDSYRCQLRHKRDRTGLESRRHFLRAIPWLVYGASRDCSEANSGVIWFKKIRNSATPFGLHIYGFVELARRCGIRHGPRIEARFEDDHNGWDGEGTGALAFAFAYNDDPNDDIADFDYRPGLKYMFRRVAGDLGDNLWDGASGNGIYSILYYPEDSEISETEIDQVWGAHTTIQLTVSSCLEVGTRMVSSLLMQMEISLLTVRI